MKFMLFFVLCFVILIVVHGSYELFAVVGGRECAESLYYGPKAITTSGSSDGQHPFFLSTNTASKDYSHKKWLQIVTSDGTTELFRIYWTFSTQQTLAQRFMKAVRSGETVSYEVHDAATGKVYPYSGIWWFSSAAGDLFYRFLSATQCCFSSNNGVWGGGPGVVDGNDIINSKLWGLGTYKTLSSTDSYCNTVFMEGRAYSYSTTVKSYMYYDNGRPTVPETPNTLFAVLGPNSCAGNLYYGPQAITTAGSADGQHKYFLSTSSASKDVTHTEWLQIVTSNDVEQFRIFWTFSTVQTLAQRFIGAVTAGEAVSYKVQTASGQVYTYSGTWWFSKTAGNMLPRFDATSTKCCFSDRYGMWGAAPGTLDGNDSQSQNAFWGVGTSSLLDSFNIDQSCQFLYEDGSGSAYPSGSGTKSYIYYKQNMPIVKQTPRSLFAVLGPNSCAGNLYYGPQAITTAGSADGQHQFYLSTNTASKDYPHTEWLQIVTNDDIEELRIHWVFATAKTLADRFQDAILYGEPVSYLVVDTINDARYSYSAIWKFSKSAGNMIPRFTATSTKCCFSDQYGMWGAAPGTLDGDDYQSPYNFWGVGSSAPYVISEVSDVMCKFIFRSGSGSARGTGTKSYMYYEDNLPTATPTAAPSNPTPQPTIAPTTAAPSAQPTTARLLPNSNFELFAVLGGGMCAEKLYYGPQNITTAGSADGLHKYFLSTGTEGRDIAHTQWLQNITVTYSGSVYVFYLISWTFPTAKTLAQRFEDAVKYGEPVTYTVEQPYHSGILTYTFSGTWWFSKAAGNMKFRFTTPTTQCCFSSNDGAWGAASGTVDGNTVLPSDFYGIANFDSLDWMCENYYQRGMYSGGGDLKVYMYYSTIGGHTVQPTVQPTTKPTAPRPPTATPPPALIQLQVAQDISGVSYSDYEANQALYDSVLQQTIVDSVPSISRSSIQDYRVTAGSSRRALSEASSLRSSADAAGPAPLSSSSSIRAQYKLVLTGTGQTYDDVRTQLEDAVQTGSFDSSLQSNAVAQGAYGLSTATSSSLSMQDDTNYGTDNDDTELLSMSAIIGIAVGGAVLLCIVLSAVVWWCRPMPNSTNAASIEALQKVCCEDPNAECYDMVASAEHDMGELELATCAPADKEIVPYAQLYSASDEEQANM